MKGVLIKEKEAETVVTAVYRHWVIGINGLGFGVPTKHVFSDLGVKPLNHLTKKKMVYYIKKLPEPQETKNSTQNNINWSVKKSPVFSLLYVSVF